MSQARPPRPPSPARRKKRARVMLVLVLFTFAACIVRLTWIQVVAGPALAQEAEKIRLTTVALPAKRGDIVDQTGTVLATSLPSYDVYVDKRFVRTWSRMAYVTQVQWEAYKAAPDKELPLDEIPKERAIGPDGKIRKGIVYAPVGWGSLEAARLLAPLLKCDQVELGGQLSGESGSFIVATHVSVETWRAIKELKIAGIDGVPSYTRVYPNGATASTVLGFTARSGDGAPGAPYEGKAGVEMTQNKRLTGEDGVRRIEISPSGQVIPGGRLEEQPARNGDTVQLTLNADLQTFAQTAIDEAVGHSDADWGTVIALDVKTGAVLALADSGQLPPEDVRQGKGSTSGSRAVQYTYEPGSTGKLVTFATGLAHNAFTPLTPVTVPYEVTMRDNQSFRDSHQHPTQRLTAAGVLAESSNTGTVQLGDKVSDKQRWDMMRALGLGARTGIEMPGETEGLISSPDKWDRRQRYTTMFGQGMAASPLQVTSMVATIANSGVRAPVHVVDSYRTPSGNVVKADHEAPKQVLDANVASTLLKMMEAVTTDEGTARAAAVPGYHTAGKTGTTQILNAAGADVGVVSSFVGALPAEDPKVAISVVIYNPKRGEIWGGTVAGPVYAKMGAQTMALLKVPPSTAPQTLYPQQAG